MQISMFAMVVNQQLASMTVDPIWVGNDETCTINSTQAGTYFVMIRAYHNYSGISLKASFGDSPLPPLDNELLNGVSISDLNCQLVEIHYCML